MKILKIELQNINSLKSDKPIVIDFESETFQDVGLFAITGPTGAGKTTILDAITIALYRRIPRFTKKIYRGLIDVISYGESEAFSRVDFENKGIRYEAFWSLRVKDKLGKTIKPKEIVRLKNLTKGIIITEKKGEIESEIELITSLNYDQFLRSMMLAQGEFASFLSANSSDKAALLEQITGEEIYKKIGEAIQQKYFAANTKLKDIKAKINEDDILSSEEEKELKLEQKELEEKVKKLGEETKLIQNILKWYQEEKKLFETQAQLEEEETLLAEEKEKSKAILAQLELHQKAKPFQADLEELKRVHSEIVKAEDKKENYNQQLSVLVQNLEIATQSVKNNKTELEKMETIWKEWLPKLEQISILDQNILNQQEEQTKVENSIQELQGKISKSTNEIEEKEKHIQRGNTKLQDLEKYFSENSQIPEIEKRISSWASQLANYKSIQESLQEEEKTLVLHRKDLQTLKIELKKKTKKFEEGEEKAGEFHDKIAALNDRLGNANLIELSERRENLVDEKERVKNLFQLSKDYAEKTQKRELISQSIAKLGKGKSELEENISQLSEKIQKAKELVEETNNVLKKEYRIQSLKEERKRLIKGEACPLCGSIEHPAVEEYQSLEISETENRLSQRRKDRENLESEKNKKEVLLAKIEADLINLKKENDSFDIENLIGKFKHPEYTIKQKDELALALQNIENVSQALTTKIKETQGIQEAKSKLEESLSNLKELQIVLSNQFIQLEQKTKDLTNRITEKDENISSLKDKASTIYSPLKEEFEHFKLEFPNLNKITTFIQDLEQKTKQYQENSKYLVEVKNALSNLKNEIETIQKQIAEKQNETKIIQKEKESILQKLSINQEKRNSILSPSISPKQKRESLQRELEAAQINYNKALDKFNQTEKEKSIRKKELSNIETELTTKRTKLEHSDLQLNEKIIHSPFANKENLEKALLSLEKEKEYQENKKQLEDKSLKLNTLKSKIETEIIQLKETKNFQISKEETLQKETEYKNQLTKYNERIGEIRSRFEINKQIKDRNKEVFTQIEQQAKEVNKWKKLIKVLGGSKDAFNTYVQRLSLQNLIHRANLHLLHLNPRYSLQMNKTYKPGEELNFHLTDHYQSNQNRLVETSSGGEKFLISLALALGLSDIASKNVNVESLFIDEGFGTLDQATLEVVISTLESLQSQGKRIGIISHVENLKNRIATQIQVSRKGNGVSEVLIS